MMMRAVVGLMVAVLGLVACSERPAAPDTASARFDQVGADLVEQGRRMSAVLGCTGCHGADLSGQDWSEPGFGRLWTSNLSRTVMDYDDAQLAATIRGGRRPDGSELWGMPSFTFADLDDRDMRAVIAFLRSMPAKGEVHPRPVFEAGARAEMAAGLFKSAPVEVAEADPALPPDLGADLALGRYIVRATCAECHGRDLRGGTPYPGAAERPDLRMVTAYDLAQFDRLMRTGAPIGDRKLELMAGVSRDRFSHFTDREVQAVHAYLQALGAIPE